MSEVFLRPRAERDLRRVGPGPDRTRVLEGLQKLASQAPNLDIKPLTGASPWLRLRIGDHRVLFRPVGPEDRVRFVVERIVHRRELDRAVGALPLVEDE